MSDLATDLAAASASGHNANEFFRTNLEAAISQLLENERTVFLDYEKWNPADYNSGNSRNGYYGRTVKTEYGELQLKVSRDRRGRFE